MCGVAGRFHTAFLPMAPGWATRAAKVLAHRGPDGAGSYRDQRCELVHRRLALIDLSPTGHQPMANEDGTVWVVYNGEIYNHRELRAMLQRRGHVFRGTSDTEVLVHLYEDEGETFVPRLNGIFAFALYDSRRGHLLLARDRFGVKPLFYTSVEGQWVFASELKAILALPEVHPRLDRQACYDFLGLGYVPEPATGFCDIAALAPGTTLTVTSEGQHTTRYYSPSARPDPDVRLHTATETMADRLVGAVGRQALADVPVAALLSGGIDSSLVVAAHQRATGTPTRTFNVRFPDAREDETHVARAVAVHCQTEHETIDPADHDMTPDAILSLLRHFDQPFADPSCLPMYWVSAAVRERGIVCALSGDGGDEAFGGYARFWRANRLNHLMRAPDFVRLGLHAAGRSLVGRTRDWGRQLAKAVQLAEAGRLDTSVLLAGLATYLSEEQKADLCLLPAREGLLPGHRHFDSYEPAGNVDIEELSRRMSETLFAVSLPSDMLRKVDMMSMRASIEVRVPLLDETMVALGMTLPHRLKTNGRTGKLVPRALARRWLPRHVSKHPKHGFNVPLDVMASPALHRAIKDLLLGTDARTRPFLNGEVVRRWVLAFAAGGGMSGGAISRGGLYQRVLMLLSLELWLRDYGLSW